MCSRLIVKAFFFSDATMPHIHREGEGELFFPSDATHIHREGEGGGSAFSMLMQKIYKSPSDSVRVPTLYTFCAYAFMGLFGRGDEGGENMESTLYTL